MQYIVLCSNREQCSGNYDNLLVDSVTIATDRKSYRESCWFIPILVAMVTLYNVKYTYYSLSPTDHSHAGVYITELEVEPDEWINEDIPVYVTPDGKVFVSSVIVNQPVLVLL